MSKLAIATETKELSENQKLAIVNNLACISVGMLRERYNEKTSKLRTLFEAKEDAELFPKLVAQKEKSRDKRSAKRYASRATISKLQLYRIVQKVYDDAYCDGFRTALRGIDPKAPGERDAEGLLGMYLPKSAHEKFHRVPLMSLAMVMLMVGFDLFHRDRPVKNPPKTKAKTRTLLRRKKTK